MIGPFIPEHLLKSKGDDSREDQAQETVDPTAADEEDDIAAYAPELPPDMLEPKAAQPQPESTSSRRRRAPIGPSLPTGPSHDDEDDDVIGPVLPAGIIEQEEDISSTINEIEERARRAKEAAEEKKDNEGGKLQRGDWMLVPPEAQFLKGVDHHKSRQFSKNEVKTKIDNSEWTDTPADKQRKLEERLSGKKRSRDREEEEEPVKMSKRDIELRNQVESYNTEKRPMSLMEMHRKNYVKSRTFEEEDASKRPFDREKDLKGGSSRMDYKRKQEMLKRAGELSSKFGSGRSGSFL